MLPPRQGAKVLYDNRFLITFRLEAVPSGDPIMASVIEGSGRVMLIPGGRWLWPQVVWRRQGEDERNYTTPLSSEEVQEEHPLWQDIVDFKFIRVLEEP